MNWEEDIDLFAGKNKPKQGRRSNPNTPNDQKFSNNDFFSDSLNPFDTNNLHDDVDGELPPKIRPRKTSVWSEEGGKSIKSSKSSSNIIEFERFNKESPRNNNGNDYLNDDDDIPIIPDIDDLQDDPLNLPDVKPIVTVAKSTYKELDNQFATKQMDKINFGNLGNTDLTFLTSKLYPEKEIKEKLEIIWTMESLFNDLSKFN